MQFLGDEFSLADRRSGLSQIRGCQGPVGISYARCNLQSSWSVQWNILEKFNVAFMNGYSGEVLELRHFTGWLRP
jgi:hypothetical protein